MSYIGPNAFLRLPKSVRQHWCHIFLPLMGNLAVDADWRGWMKTNMEGRWTWDGIQFHFESERDAVLFKLRFC